MGRYFAPALMAFACACKVAEWTEAPGAIFQTQWLQIAVGNADDHFHVVVRHPPRVSVAQIAHRLKGASSRSLHLTLSQTQGLVWQVGYWAESVTHPRSNPLSPTF